MRRVGGREEREERAAVKVGRLAGLWFWFWLWVVGGIVVGGMVVVVWLDRLINGLVGRLGSPLVGSRCC